MAWDDSHIASHGQALKNILGQTLYFFAPSVIGSARGKVDPIGLDWLPLRCRRLLCKARCSRALNSCSTALTLFCIHLCLVVLSFQEPPVNEVVTHQSPLSLNYKWVFVSTLQKEEVWGTPENNVLSPNLVSGLLMVSVSFLHVLSAITFSKQTSSDIWEVTQTTTGNSALKNCSRHRSVTNPFLCKLPI